MPERLLLDTHIALWLDSGHRRLRPATRALIDDTWRSSGRICLSAVTVWEIALLADTGRVVLDLSPEDWTERFADRPGVEIIALTYTAAARAYRLSELEHRDPADRLLIATAIELCCPLVTYDDRIRNFAIDHGEQHGFATAS